MALTNVDDDKLGEFGRKLRLLAKGKGFKGSPNEIANALFNNDLVKP